MEGSLWSQRNLSAERLAAFFRNSRLAVKALCAICRDAITHPSGAAMLQKLAIVSMVEDKGTFLFL
jgi:hypothetical protein